jgi:hypothetical protein
MSHFGNVLRKEKDMIDFWFLCEENIILKIGLLGCCAYKAWRLQDVQRENSKKKN